MKTYIKYIIFRLTPHLFFDNIYYLFARKENIDVKSDKEKKAYIFLGCDYANLGDYAITVAQQELLHFLYPDRQVHVFPIDKTYSGIKTVLSNGNADDIITIIGGGNMGELYYGYERKRNFVVSKLHNYKVVSFPQSMIWGKNALATLGLKRAAKTYKFHPNLLLLAREELSYDKMKKAFGNNHIELLPDAVLTLNKKKNLARKGVVLSLRYDKESILSIDEKKDLVASLKDNGFLCQELDTCTVDNLQLNEAFDRLLMTYSKAEVVITDRLHGMIFAYITGTPAIVIPNNNGKIVHSYKWIEDCGYVKLINKQDISLLPTYVQQMKSMSDSGSFETRRQRFIKMYQKVICK